VGERVAGPPPAAAAGPFSSEELISRVVKGAEHPYVALFSGFFARTPNKLRWSAPRAVLGKRTARVARLCVSRGRYPLERCPSARSARWDVLTVALDRPAATSTLPLVPTWLLGSCSGRLGARYGVAQPPLPPHTPRPANAARGLIRPSATATPARPQPGARRHDFLLTPPLLHPMHPQMVKLKAFSQFENTTEALAAATTLVDAKLGKALKKFLVKHAGGDTVAVADPKLGSLIKEKCDLPCVWSTGVQEMMRGVRGQIEGLVAGLSGHDLRPMALGLSHSLSRYKLKFSPDKIDTMVVQAVSLLDDLDKELNTYAMRTREWYGWHFPEMGKLVADNVSFARVVRDLGDRDALTADFSGLEAALSAPTGADQGDGANGMAADAEDLAKEVTAAAAVSMGTEMSDEDLAHVRELAGQVVALSEYRAQLYGYLRSRMQAIAPNLTVLVGELVGARLVAHAGSLLTLAKHPASTVQILGAEKALFRALKTKKETPKYGLIFHASLVGQAAPKLKGKISRVLAAKISLGTRVDALGDDAGASVGIEGRGKVEARLRQLEGRAAGTEGGGGAGRAKTAAYEKSRGGSGNYDTGGDVVGTPGAGKKRAREAEPGTPEEPATDKKAKKAKSEKREKKEKGEKSAKKAKT